MEHNNHQIFNTVDEVLKFQRKCLDCHRLTPLQVLSRIIEENDGR